ncbi:uncharacterized protein LOC127287669 isoform X2 [Leptopilina boulardi]|uniref:uncharacterized protein LOC127287669 isoform X2 n=1 Tax=Leptopilina boulardi TaxID=63433 RepID=UPI0021F5D47B|nr:uncharacterized protein LOC127287669 isoform X2 [Leptopilina boulardi]
MNQGSIQCQGTQRRSCAPGANWNVQVVRSKKTTRCLWHACKALGIGLLLMLLGACMATIGYFADQLSEAQEIRGNRTIKVKNESRGFHLNNLSYAGPIVMGVGGFIVVAACVMTFEARDSAAKVGPARLRLNQTSSIKQTTKSQRNINKSIPCQTSKWDQQPGLFRTPSPSSQDATKKQFTTSGGVIEFSNNSNNNENSHTIIKKSPSAPTLVEKKSPRQRAPKFSGCALLNPELLQRYAASVDNPTYNSQTMKENLDQQKMNGSQVSMAMDLHFPNKGPVTLKVKDRRRQLERQTKIEDLEEVSEARKTEGIHSPQLPSVYSRFPEDFVPRKRNSIDLKTLDELNIKDSLKTSPRDFRKVSSPNFRKMSFDRLGSDRRSERSLGSRKASLDFKRSPDFRKHDYRKYSIERFTADCARYLQEESENRAITASGENLRKQKMMKLHYSRSDDRRRSFDKFHGESQCSRYSLNAPENELKYFASSLDTDASDDSRIIDFEEQEGCNLSPDAIPSALVEEPELENLTETTEESRKFSIIDTQKMNENIRNLEEAANEIEIYADDNESETSVRDTT